MLPMENIPDEVVEHMLSYLLSEEWKSDNRFKHNLFYLTICPRWRRLAKPMLFKEAFINYDKEMDKNVDGNIENLLDGREAETGAETELKHYKLITNLHLAQDMGCSNVIRHINVNIEYLDSPYPCLDKVIELLENVSMPCRINRLALYMFPYTHIQNNGNDINTIIDKIAITSMKLVKILPEIQHLTVSATVSDRIASILYGQIAEHYSGQLKGLDFQCSINLSSQCAFTQLEHAKLAIDNINDISCIRISAENLKTLQISGNINLSSLDLCATFDSGIVIAFPHLEFLSLASSFKYSDNEIQINLDNRNFKLVLPKLRKLDVYDASCNYNYHVLNQIVLPNYINSISIQVSNSIFKALANRPLPAASNVKLSTLLSEANPEIVQNIGQIYKRYAQCQSATMGIMGSTIPINVDDITCTKLTVIKILAPLHVSTIIMLLEKLPKLTTLFLPSVVLSDLPNEIVIPEISCHNQHPVVPFNSNLNGLYIMFEDNGYSVELVIQVALYFLLKLPKLHYFWSIQAPKDIFIAQLKQYKPFYHHISNVEFKLDSRSLNN